MTPAEYKRLRVVRGAPPIRVRSRRMLTNQNGSIPAGTIFTVDGKHGGLSLASERCGTCGVSFRVTKVPHGDVDLVGGNP